MSPFIHFVKQYFREGVKKEFQKLANKGIVLQRRSDSTESHNPALELLRTNQE